MAGQQPKWRYYIRVPSISAARETIDSTGGTILMGPHQVPTGEYIIIGTDPQGAEFALVGRE
jgi:predicted enzyme related to lactoylglutathione lyase